MTTETGHGREETRTYLQLPAPEGLPGYGLWKALKTIAVVTSLCIRDGKQAAEVRSYISSLAMDVKRLARAVRGHWGIENQLHWQLDVSFREDESRVRTGHAAANLSVIRRFALGLLKRETSCRKGIEIKRIKCASNDEYREKILFMC